MRYPSLAAGNKVAETIRTYAEAALWLAAAQLLRETGKSRWEQVSRQDVQRWIAWLLDGYSDAYPSNQFRALQQSLAANPQWRVVALVLLVYLGIALICAAPLPDPASIGRS